MDAAQLELKYVLFVRGIITGLGGNQMTLIVDMHRMRENPKLQTLLDTIDFTEKILNCHRQWIRLDYVSSKCFWILYPTYHAT